MTLVLRCLLALLLFAAAACSSSKPATTASSATPAAPAATVVYVVRHAEKGTVPPQDPPLTAAGSERALALREALNGQPVSQIYTSNTQRARATVAPLAAANKLEPSVYDPRQLGELAKLIKAQPIGKTIVVVGHSNTVLETVEALGAARPVVAVTDADYNYLFKVTLPASGEATATATRYGAGAQ